MPVEQRSGRSDRCSQHPGVASVRRCDGCGRSLCLSCAIPVRGLVLGAECLAQALGEEAPPDDPAVPAALTRPVTVGAFAVAALATVPAWTTLGNGSGMLGAWSGAPRWSTLAAAGAVAGLVVAVAAGRIAVGSRWWSVALAVLGAGVVLASALAWFRPPFPAEATPVPWFAAAAGAVASIAALTEQRRFERA